MAVQQKRRKVEAVHLGVFTGRKLFATVLHEDALDLVRFFLDDGGWVVDTRKNIITKNITMRFEDQSIQSVDIWFGHTLIAPNRGFRLDTDLKEGQQIASPKEGTAFQLQFQGILTLEKAEVLYPSRVYVSTLFFDDLEKSWKRFDRWIKSRFSKEKTPDTQRPYVSNPTYLIGPAAKDWADQHDSHYILGRWEVPPVKGLNCRIDAQSYRGADGI